MKRRALITGAAGFLGRHAARHLSAAGWEVWGIDLVAPENAGGDSLHRYIQIRLPDEKLVELVAEIGPDACVHCAGRAAPGLSMSQPAEDFQANVVVTFSLLEALRSSAPGCRTVLLSSAAVYGTPVALPVAEDAIIAPLSPYGFHKRAAELLVQEHARVFGLSTASVRIFSAYGPGLRRQVVWDVTRKALTNNRVLLRGTGTESRDFIHGLDVAHAVETVLEAAPMRGESYNVATGREVTIRELAEHIANAVATDVEIDSDGVLPEGTPRNWRADVSAIRNLGFTPKVDLERGIESFVRWSRGELGFDVVA